MRWADREMGAGAYGDEWVYGVARGEADWADMRLSGSAWVLMLAFASQRARAEEADGARVPQRSIASTEAGGTASGTRPESGPNGALPAASEPFGSPTRLALEALGGVLGAAALGLVGAGAYAPLATPEGEDCSTCGLDFYGYLAFGTAGALIGLPLGVHAAGELAGARGSVGATYLGELGGVAAAALLGGALYELDADRPAAFVLVVSPLFALGGAILGRELSTQPAPLGAGASGSAGARLSARLGRGGGAVLLSGTL